MISNNFSRFPYEECLISNLPEEIQHRVRDMANYVVRPLDMLLAVMSLVFNALICITVARTKSLQRPSLLMLCSLSVTDLIYSQFSLYVNIKTVLIEHLCLANMGLKDTITYTLCTGATLGTLAVISRDRYLAVTKPFWYRNHVTKSRAIKMSCIPWLISVVLILGHVFYVIYKFDSGFMSLVHGAAFLVYYCICFIIIIFSHLCIYFKKQPIDTIREIHVVMKKEKKSAATIRWILLVLLLTFMPAFWSPVALTMKGVENFGAYRPYYFILYTVNGFLNPLLNFGRNKEMRRALRGLFRCFQHVQQQPVPPPPQQQKQPQPQAQGQSQQQQQQQ